MPHPLSNGMPNIFEMKFHVAFYQLANQRKKTHTRSSSHKTVKYWAKRCVNCLDELEKGEKRLNIKCEFRANLYVFEIKGIWMASKIKLQTLVEWNKKILYILVNYFCHWKYC